MAPLDDSALSAGLVAARPCSTISCGPSVRLYIPASGSDPYSGALLGIRQGEMHIRTNQWLGPGLRVNAVFTHVTIPGEVLYCSQKDDWFRVCVAVISPEGEQPRTPRLSVRQPGTVYALSDETSVSTPGMLLDLSVSGMRVEMLHQVEPGTMIFIETRSTLVVGEVRRCVQGDDGRFETGVAITDILTGVESAEPHRQTVRNLRWRIAEAILGEPIGFNSRRSPDPKAP